MGDFLQMDIFFAVTTAVTLLVGIFVVVILFYVLRILRSVDRIVQDVSEESILIRRDIGEFRARVKSGGLSWRLFTNLIGSFMRGTKKKKPSQSKKSGDAEDGDAATSGVS